MFTHSDDTSRIADLLHANQESQNYALCYLSSICPLSPRKKRTVGCLPGLPCWAFWSGFLPAIGSNHRRREEGRRARSGEIPSLSAPSGFDTVFSQYLLPSIAPAPAGSLRLHGPALSGLWQHYVFPHPSALKGEWLLTIVSFWVFHRHLLVP